MKIILETFFIFPFSSLQRQRSHRRWRRPRSQQWLQRRITGSGKSAEWFLCQALLRTRCSATPWFRLKMPRRSWLLSIRRHRVLSPESSLRMCPRRQNRCMSCFRPRCRWHPLFPLPRRYVPPDLSLRYRYPRRQSMCTLRCQLRYRWHPCCPLPRRYASRSPGLLPAWFFP